MNKFVQIALDGPAGAGKSSVAKALAQKLKIQYLDTGKMYRALAYYILKHKIDISSSHQIRNMLNQISINVDVDSIFINSEDVTPYVRNSEVTNFVSAVASKKEIRKFLVQKQQEIADAKSIVMDGRDIGTVVLPNAKFKFFIDASPEERARRRLKDMKLTEEHLEKIKNEIIRRDEKDKNRSESPLMQAKDAVYFDTTHLSFDEVVNQIILKIKNKMEL